jgi:hypothetical protein
MAKAEIRTAAMGFKPGEVVVIGKEPKYAPYVSIRDGDYCVAVIEKRAMNALIRAWKRATAGGES